MLTYYCELDPDIAKQRNMPEYCTFPQGVAMNVWNGRNLNELMLFADRIWVQDDEGNVKFAKHRYSNPENTAVDLEEFMFVKLRSVPV